MAIFEVASDRKIVKKSDILSAHMYMENIGSTPPPPSILEVASEKNRQSKGHSGGTYVYGHFF